MLKKLAKYGNSTMLVIDKAILELLNMDESSTVKLHTDGTSLVITPVTASDKKKISYVPDEAILASSQGVHREAEQNPVHPSMQTAMQLVFKRHFERNKEVMERFTKEYPSHEEFNKAVGELTQKYDPVSRPVEYSQAHGLLVRQYFPYMVDEKTDKELAAISQKKWS